MKKLLILVTLISGSFSADAQLDSTIIPIRLSYLEAVTNVSAVTLKWKTACFLDYASFDIQRSTNGINYSTINSFSADQLRCQQPFDYTVNGSTISGRIFYRIIVSDINGKSYHSKTVSVFTDSKGFVVNSFSPTIINTSAAISISAAVAETVQLSVFNLQGVLLKQMVLAVPKGASTHQLSMEGLQSGRYQALFLRQRGEKEVINFIKL